ncbi:hypothetical protein F4553_005206 [Allocatelliglobosispora scoriae]|uniref:Tissue inhibitor of metalloproteinase n=1 Tax=Allocatelliglobosispora scoriae TaxID=643052 RepID=A0A841BS02_9ACTN|nr:hypothetical protein [Allocatelliglobosispora scoriae]MBB5871827.1 hypothetical protein [Allocatelliglobosispora scoriae]
MRRLIQAAVLIIVATFAVVIGESTAWACSCAEPNEAQSVEWSDLTFVGVVVDIDRPLLSQSSGDDMRVHFAVESVSKGAQTTEVTIRTSQDSASCGAEFVEGTRYRVHSLAGRTSLCDNNVALGAAPEVPLESDVPYLWIAIAAGGVLVLIGIVIAMRRRRATP